MYVYDLEKSLLSLSAHPPTGLEEAILHEFLCKDINSVNNLNVSLEADSSPAKLLMKPQPWPIHRL